MRDTTSRRTGEFSQFEILRCCVTAGNSQLSLILVYRPPPSATNGLSVPLFLDEWATLLEKLNLSPHEALITGDLNFHIDDPTNADANRFTALVESYGFTQHVNGPTHKDGHTLDVIITRDTSTFSRNRSTS